MSKWIRWPGFIVFGVICLTLTVFMYFFADDMMETSIEYGGTEALGAKVELANSSLKLSPLGFQLTELQVTNPNEPMSNIVQVGNMRFAMDTHELARLKFIINEINIENIRFNTRRKSSGAVAGRVEKHDKNPQQDASSFSFSLPATDTPDIDTILKNETLQSVELASKVEQQAETLRSNWDQKSKTLPDEKKINEYKKEISKINVSPKGNTVVKLKAYAEAQKKLKKIKIAVQKDLKNFKQTRKQLANEYKDLKTKVKELEKAPKADIQRLSEKYSIDFKGLENISRALFGNQVDQWIKEARYWHAQLAPYLESAETNEVSTPARFEGIDIVFKEKNPIPDFLVKTGKISFVLPVGSIEGSLSDFSSDQFLLGKPGVLRLAASQMKGVQGVEILGLLKPEKKLATSLKVKVSGLTLEKFSMVKDEKFPLTLDQGQVNIRIDGNFSLDSINTQIQLSFNNTKLNLPKSDANKWMNALSNAVARINQFNIRATAKGDFANYKVKIKSDLDSVFSDAMGHEFKDQIAQFRENLDAKLTEKFNAKLAQSKLNEHVKGVESIDDLLKNRERLVKNISQSYQNKLKQAIAGQKKEQKAQLLGKKNTKVEKKAETELKSKLKNKLKF